MQQVMTCHWVRLCTRACRPVDSCAGHTVKMPSGFMMQSTDNCGNGSCKPDRRSADEASVTRDLKVPSKLCESIVWDDELEP